MENTHIDKSRESQLIAKVPKGAIFEHYKGEKYKILGIGRHTETLEMCVIYQALYGSPEFGDHAIWVRPLAMFLETVIVNDREMPRFRYISEGIR